MVTFTEEQLYILNKNKGYYNKLKYSGALRRINSSIILEFRDVYESAGISTTKVNIGCAACIVEMIELLYLNYDKYLKDRLEDFCSTACIVETPELLYSNYDKHIKDGIQRDHEEVTAGGGTDVIYVGNADVTQREDSGEEEEPAAVPKSKKVHRPRGNARKNR